MYTTKFVAYSPSLKKKNNIFLKTLTSSRMKEERDPEKTHILFRALLEYPPVYPFSQFGPTIQQLFFPLYKYTLFFFKLFKISTQFFS